MIDVTKASRETRDRVVAAYAEWREARLEPGALPVAQELDRAWQQLRAECAAPKLRSRAEVDTELVKTIRQSVIRGPAMDCLMNDADPEAEVIRELCAEPTAEEPTELDLSEHEVCSCEEAEGLKARVAELERQLPEGMQNCTIKFIECPVGHGTLTATNWVQGPCQQCRIDALRGRVTKLEEAIEQAIGWSEHAINHDSVERATRILREAGKS